MRKTLRVVVILAFAWSCIHADSLDDLSRSLDRLGKNIERAEEVAFVNGYRAAQDGRGWLDGINEIRRRHGLKPVTRDGMDWDRLAKKPIP